MQKKSANFCHLAAGLKPIFHWYANSWILFKSYSNFAQFIPHSLCYEYKLSKFHSWVLSKLSVFLNYYTNLSIDISIYPSNGISLLLPHLSCNRCSYFGLFTPLMTKSRWCCSNQLFDISEACAPGSTKKFLTKLFNLHITIHLSPYIHHLTFITLHSSPYIHHHTFINIHWKKYIKKNK